MPNFYRININSFIEKKLNNTNYLFFLRVNMNRPLQERFFLLQRCISTIENIVKKHLDFSLCKRKFQNGLLSSMLLLASLTPPLHAQTPTWKQKDLFQETERQTDSLLPYQQERLGDLKSTTIARHDISKNTAFNEVSAKDTIESPTPQKTTDNDNVTSDKSDKKEELSGIDSLSSVIRGIVTDENHKPLANITVHDKTTDSRITTDKSGLFTIGVATKGELEFHADKYQTKTVAYKDTSFVTVRMYKKSIQIEGVDITSDVVRDNPTKFIDLSNRAYMNLSQVLQGTVPGLSMQYVNVSNRVITGIDVLTNTGNGLSGGAVYETIRYTQEQFLRRYPTNGQQELDRLLNGEQIPGYTIYTTTNVVNTMVPQIRGVNNFAEAAATMLVVIDGFPQENFPADYPMVNVASIRVERDPKELTKWGPEAAGGAIFITSKPAKKGQINVNYSMNMYFAPAVRYNREDLHLASTSEFLDYLYDMNSIYTSEGYGADALQLSPARELLNSLNTDLISPEVFSRQWDSLRTLDNSSQIALLQQDQFSQNHTLTLSGGVKQYSFTATANYINNQTQALNGYNKTLGLNLNNNFSLLKDKMKITWLINYSNASTRAGYTFTPTSAPLDPYQMLLDPQGNYVYDYSGLSIAANQLIMENGYRNHGVNILEDALGTNSTTNEQNLRSNFNLKWNILPGLNFNTAFLYEDATPMSNNHYGSETSYVRQLVNTYGALTSSGINFYVPYGDIMQRNSGKRSRLNLRTSLDYSKKIGDHRFSVNVGGGGASESNITSASQTLYGYNERTDTGTPIFLSAANNASAINNYSSLIGLSGTAIPSSLLVPLGGDSSTIRNINMNGSFNYAYSDRLSMSANYIGSFSPVYGTGGYSTMASYNGDVTGLIAKDLWNFFHRVSVSVGGTVTQMPNQPATYGSTRYQQPLWNNYAIWVNNINVAQQSGQRTSNMYQKLNLSMADSAITVNLGYNTQQISGNVNTTAYDSIQRNSTVIRYPSAGIQLNLRKKLFKMQVDYNKSPEGTSQVNGRLLYDIANESYFKAKNISELKIDATLQNISSYQGLEVMMGTNVSSSGGFGAATVTDLTALPPSNINFEAGVTMSMMQRKYTVDLRYYNRRTSGLTSTGVVVTDPSTGVSSATSYSTMSNRGVEFFFRDDLIQRSDWGYSFTLNGAYNQNMAISVPTSSFVATSTYTKAMREGYSVDNIWALDWAGLSNEGEPQYYDSQGNIRVVEGNNTVDSAAMADALVYKGVTRAPWNGGFIQDFRYKSFFARVAISFSLGYVMRYYIPYAGNNDETHELIADRWRNPGDEQFTDIAVATADANSAREFVARYSSNSILPADNIRLQEVMIGYNMSSDFTKKFLGMKSLTMTLQVQNLAAWYKNKYGIDPASVSASGQVGFKTPTTYSCSLSASF